RGVPRQRRCARERGVEKLVVDLTVLPASALQLVGKPKWHRPEVHVRYIAVGNVERGPRGVPHKLCRQLRGRCLDALDEVAALGGTVAPWKPIDGAERNLACARGFVFPLELCREHGHCLCRDLVLAGLRDETFEGGLVTGGGVVAHGDVAAERQPREIGIKKGGAVRIAGMKTQ